MHLFSGFIDSPFTSRQSDYPLYSFTVADKTRIFHDIRVELNDFRPANPSLPLSYIVYRLALNSRIFALAPKHYDSELVSVLKQFISYVEIQTGFQNLSAVFKLFDSSEDIDNYVRNSKYDNEGYKAGKIGIALVLNVADKVKSQWDYTISKFVLNKSRGWGILYRNLMSSVVPHDIKGPQIEIYDRERIG